MIVNVINGNLNKDLYNTVHIVKVFGYEENEIKTINMVNEIITAQEKKDYQLYDSETIEEESKTLFKALLYNNGVDAEKFEGTIEIYEV